MLTSHSPESTLFRFFCRRPFKEWTNWKRGLYPKECFRDYWKGRSSVCMCVHSNKSEANMKQILREYCVKLVKRLFGLLGQLFQLHCFSNRLCPSHGVTFHLCSGQWFLKYIWRMSNVDFLSPFLALCRCLQSLCQRAYMWVLCCVGCHLREFSTSFTRGLNSLQLNWHSFIKTTQGIVGCTQLIDKKQLRCHGFPFHYAYKNIFHFRYDIDFTSPEIDLLFSKLPSEANGFVSFEELVQYSFLNFNVTSHGNEGAQSGKLTLGNPFSTFPERIIWTLFVPLIFQLKLQDPSPSFSRRFSSFVFQIFCSSFFVQSLIRSFAHSFH